MKKLREKIKRLEGLISQRVPRSTPTELTYKKGYLWWDSRVNKCICVGRGDRVVKLLDLDDMDLLNVMPALRDLVDQVMRVTAELQYEAGMQAVDEAIERLSGEQGDISKVGGE